MRELSNIEATEGLNETFTDIVSLAQGCKFGNCTHIQEPGCSVIEAVETGRLNKKHYQNFLKLNNRIKN